MKERLNLTVESDYKKLAQSLSDETRLSISEIFELLIKGTSEEEILKLYKKDRKQK